MSLLLAALALSATALADVQAHARLDSSSEQLSVEYCASAGGALILRGDRSARARLIRIEPAPQRDGGDRLEWMLAKPGCVSLVHDLGRIADSRRQGVGWRVGDDLLAYADTWWWRPSTQASTRLQLQLPAGWSLSAPWARCGDSEQCRTVPAEPWDQPTLTVFGPFAARSTRVGAARIDTAVIGRVQPQQADTWLAVGSRAAALIAQAHGTVPTPQLQIVIVPWGTSAQPIAFGQINRGGLGGVQLFVDAQATATALEKDWVLPHELAHLLHPYLGRGRGRWLAEGLASYYQNILRARLGLITADDAWDRFFAGLERGRADRSPGALDVVADRRGGYMRTYWAGAAFWLDIDLSLRERGHPGLDHLLAQFAREHLPALQDWTADRFLTMLDAQLETSGCAAMLGPRAATAGMESSFPASNPLRARLARRPDNPADTARALSTGAAIMAPLALPMSQQPVASCAH